MPDIIAKARKLQLELRTARNTDKTVRITRKQVDLLDRGLCSLISNYEAGKPVRDIWPKNLKALRKEMGAESAASEPKRAASRRR